MHALARAGLAAVLLAAVFPAGRARAAPPGFGPDAAVPAATLAGYRGGFETPAGMTVTLGLERIVTLDGGVAMHSRLEFGDLARLTGGLGSGPGSGPNSGAVTLLAQALLPGATIIQNALSGALIQHTTIIDASVDAHGMLQAMHFQATLANALNNAAGAR